MRPHRSLFVVRDSNGLVCVLIGPYSSLCFLMGPYVSL